MPLMYEKIFKDRIEARVQKIRRLIKKDKKKFFEDAKAQGITSLKDV